MSEHAERAKDRVASAHEPRKTPACAYFEGGDWGAAAPGGSFQSGEKSTSSICYAATGAFGTNVEKACPVYDVRDDEGDVTQ